MNKKQTLWGVVNGILIILGLYQVVNYPYWLDFLLVTFFGTAWMFTGGIYAKSLFEQGKGGSFLIWVWAPGVAAFMILDVLFNLVFGTLFFREIPKEFLFTTRVKRHMNSAGFQGRVARRWASRLNFVDPGHV